jgi:hydroxypyruvate isomerase
VKRRNFLGRVALGSALAPALGMSLNAAPGAGAPAQAPAAAVARKGRIKQALWRTTFGDKSPLSFDDMCREAARLGCHGFDMAPPEDWPTLRKHGLRPTLGTTGGVDFPNGLIHPEVHDKVEAAIRPHIDLLAKNEVRTFISVGGQRRGMPYEQAADNAVAFLNRIKRQLEDRQVTIAIENMNNRRTDPRFGREDQVFGHWAWGVGVCERVNSPNVKLVCDIYHLQIMDGDVAEYTFTWPASRRGTRSTARRS